MLDVDRITRDTLRRLTVLEEKALLFGQESFSREAMRDATDLIDGADIEPLLLRHGTMIIKAESVALRLVDEIADRLSGAGFTVVSATRLRLDRQTIRTLWWYVLSAATLDRLDLLDLFKPAASSILLVVRDDDAIPGVPAAVRLQQFKGPTLPHQRSQGHLRAGLGPPNRLLNFVHAADEPADVLREFGLLLDRNGRRAVIERLLGGTSAAAELAHVRDLVYGEDPSHDLEARPALARLEAAVKRTCPPAVAAEVAHLLAGLLDQALEEAALRWHEVHARLWPYASDLGTWDYVVVGSSVCLHDEPESARVIPDPIHGGWDELWSLRAAGEQQP